MHSSLKAWLVPVLLLGTIAYAMAADYTTWEMYPSPMASYDLLVANKVGIGTNAPAPFSVVPDPNAPTLQVNGSPFSNVRLTANDAAGVAIVDSGLIADAASNTLLIGGITPGTAVTFWTRDTTSTPPSERARIIGKGDVGIGTPTPTARLDVQGSGTTTATKTLRIANGATPTPQDIMVVNDAGDVTLGDTSQGGKLTLSSTPGSPSTSAPPWTPVPVAGTIRYSAADANTYVSNGSTWVEQGGGGGKIMTLLIYTATSPGASPQNCPTSAAGVTSMQQFTNIGYSPKLPAWICKDYWFLNNGGNLADGIAMGMTYAPPGGDCGRLTGTPAGPISGFMSGGGNVYQKTAEQAGWTQYCYYKCTGPSC